MSGRIFVIADLHLGHEKTCSVFKREDGTPLRPFKNAHEMNEEIVRRWNERVTPQDHVYVLGDVAMNKKELQTVRRLMGKKRLVYGNHDICDWSEYVDVGFQKLMAYRVFAANVQQKIPGAILSHVPIHPASLQRWAINVHGHLHAGRVRLGPWAIDPKYICVSVEHTDYAPILLEDILRANKAQYQEKESRHDVD